MATSQKRNTVVETSAHDLRRANRPGRDRSPDIEADVTGKELDRATLAELRSLDERNALWVAKHLVMTYRLLDEDPALAFEHALAASRRGGRLGLVREAAGLAAYRAGLYHEALRELKTYRRMTGDNVHLPVIADSERGLGRPGKALSLAEEAKGMDLPLVTRAELAMVVAGACHDQGNLRQALDVLEAEPALRKDKAYVFSPRLFEIYATFLEEAGQEEKAEEWKKLADLAQKALDRARDGDDSEYSLPNSIMTDEEISLVDTTV